VADIATAFSLAFRPYVLSVIFLSAIFGLIVGAIPGLTATMATALLVPVTFFMPPVPAIASIVTATAMAISSGDISGALIRIPGTPASAAFTDESYAMTRKGQAETVLGADIVFSVIGGLFGTVVLVVSAPSLAEIALKFSSFEYFWLVPLGLSPAVMITVGDSVKGVVSLLLGLLISAIGLDNPAAYPRFTFGSIELLGFFERPIAAGLGILTLIVWLWPLATWRRRAGASTRA
jgi:TctA family transporter